MLPMLRRMAVKSPAVALLGVELLPTRNHPESVPLPTASNMLVGETPMPNLANCGVSAVPRDWRCEAGKSRNTYLVFEPQLTAEPELLLEIIVVLARLFPVVQVPSPTSQFTPSDAT